MVNKPVVNAVFLMVCALGIIGCAGLEPQVDFPPGVGLSQTQTNLLGVQPDKDWQAEKDRQAQLYQQVATFGSDKRPGSIYSNAGFRSIYEDNKAKYVGDIVIVDLLENTNAIQAKSTSASRDDSVSVTVPSVGPFNGVNGGASGNKNFSGDGRTAASNLLTGTVTTRVIEVLPNGYLRVAGEKQLGINRQVETIRFYGVVDPFTLRPGSRVVSSNVADARVEYVGEGTIDNVQMMGWLSRVFLTVLPF
jgi:flagellar L-ring protein FlgH